MQYVDTYELTHLGSTVQGTSPIARFTRLTADLPPQSDTQVVWAVTGEIDARHQRFLRVAVKATPVLECQRCLQPFEWAVETKNRLQLVRSESDLEIQGVEESESDDLVERIVGSARLDVLELIEDELILSLPYVPKHDVCPSSPVLPAQDAPEPESGKPSPFAVLSQLKKN